MAQKTVIEHVLAKLNEIGITDMFGVAGDFAFPIEDAVCAANSKIRWVGNCNELNAAYAADGYARIKGMAALSTTYGVGELSAMNGIAGSFSEFLPIFHLVGMPETSKRECHNRLHHTIGAHEFSVFQKMSDAIVCASAVLSQENCVAETDRLIAAALYHRQPVYFGIPADVALMKVDTKQSQEPSMVSSLLTKAKIATGVASSEEKTKSDPIALEGAIQAIVRMVNESKDVCVLPGILISRWGLQDTVERLISEANLPYATMVMDKGILDEGNPNYIGMYVGKLVNPPVQEYIEKQCDCILVIGAMLTDFNTGFFTASLDRNKQITIMPHCTQVGPALFEKVEMNELLGGLVGKITRKASNLNLSSTKTSLAWSRPEIVDFTKPITVDFLYSRWQEMIRPNDILISDTGTSGWGLDVFSLPSKVSFLNQTKWGSIGWATPAALGAAMADRSRRIVLVTGEGAHQLTVQEVCQFHRYGLRPIIFVLNNQGYLIERILSTHPEHYYNDIPQWRYDKIPAALGCDNWFTARVQTCGELDKVIQSVDSLSGNTAAYIEVVTDKYLTPKWFAESQKKKKESAQIEA